MTVLDVERPIQLAAGLLPVQQLGWKAASEAYHHLIPSAKSFLIESKAQVLQQQHLQNPPSCVDPAKLNTDQRSFPTHNFKITINAIRLVIFFSLKALLFNSMLNQRH